MIATLNDVLIPAKKQGYAVGLFNTINAELATGVFSAAESLRSPVIVGTAEVLLPFGDLEELSYLLLPMAKRASVPVVLHFDHGTTLENTVKAIELGFSSVMFDRSDRDFEENLRQVSELTNYAHKKGVTVEAELKDKIFTIGENMNIRRFARIEGNVCSYIHGGGRIGVLVEAEGSLADEAAYEAARDVAMQIAAINPLYLSKDTVPAEDVEKEKKIIVAQIKEDPKNASKPDNIIEKMVGGKINKFFEQNCLLQQEFVKDGDFKVEAYLSSKGVKLVNYVRFEKGEGIEKKEDNFADEVASMIK